MCEGLSALMWCVAAHAGWTESRRAWCSDSRTRTSSCPFSPRRPLCQICHPRPHWCAQPLRPTCVPSLCAQPVYAFPSPTVSLPYAPNATLHASYMRRYTRRHTRRHARRHTQRHTRRHTRARSNSRGCHTARRPFPVTIPTHPQRPSPIVGGVYAEVALQKREAEAQCTQRSERSH